ncbi:MAG: hypothetical protein PUC62_07980, partial [Oscillospiraceae bacterium]|nr:hypothetical protein [Oscillospiraceae bacterium]
YALKTRQYPFPSGNACNISLGKGTDGVTKAVYYFFECGKYLVSETTLVVIISSLASSVLEINAFPFGVK